MTFQLYDYPGGKIYLDLDEGEYAHRMLKGEYEPEFTNKMLAYLKPGMIFVDVGAHVGYYSLWAAKLVGETGMVLAFEPWAYLFDYMANAALENGYKWLIFSGHAIGNENSNGAVFYRRDYTWGGSLHHELGGKEAFVVALRTLDYLWQDFQSWTPDVIKIDAEGAELDVLRGAQDTIARCKHLLLLIAIHPEYGVTYDMLRELLEPQGFVLERQTNGNQVIATR